VAGLALLPLMLGMPLILTPIHIAFLEMVIDPACSVVFEAEKEEDDVMLRPPRDSLSPLLLPKRILWAVLQGFIALAIMAGVFIGAVQMGMLEADVRTVVFTSLVLINIAMILVNRSFKASLFQALLKPNRSLWVLIGAVLIVLAVAVFWRPAQLLFHFGHLHWDELALAAVAGLLSLLLLEAIKAIGFQVGDEKSKVRQSV
jgi:Ca2+-transporting ATPase